MVTQNRKQENDSRASSPAREVSEPKSGSCSGSRSSKKPSNSDGTFLDLRTTQGQILFLLITITISSLIQLLPNDFLKNIILKEKVSLNGESSKAENIARTSCQAESITAVDNRPKYSIFHRGSSLNHLRHVEAVLQRLGFRNTSVDDDWDVLWAHDYPFRVLYPRLHQKLGAHQRVNHFPGCGFLTNKVDLATTDLKYIPKSFKLPDDQAAFMEYANIFPDKLFVQKHYQHRHIFIKPIKEINLSDNETFIQEFVDNPLLVDGHKFDMGVYVIITSIDPLRVYIYTGDILFRYCPVKYYPFDANNVDKYIVGDDYLPTWEVPSLAPYYNGLGFGMKDSFDAFLRKKGRDPKVVWEQVEDAIRIAVIEKESHIVNILKQFKSKKNFFEMMRFDLIVDDNLRVYLMEANMSPNLSSAHFLPNTLLYEQVIYNLLNLVGVGAYIQRETLHRKSTDTEIMLSADKNIATSAEQCSRPPCSESCAEKECKLCRPCLSATDIRELHTAYREHVNRGDTKRIFPPAIRDKSQVYFNEEEFEKLLPKNQWMAKWFYEKCLMEESWCS